MHVVNKIMTTGTFFYRDGPRWVELSNIFFTEMDPNSEMEPSSEID